MKNEIKYVNGRCGCNFVPIKEQTMSDELEIMREFEEKFPKVWALYSKDVKEQFIDWFEPAVKREIVRLLGEMARKTNHGSITYSEILEYITKYSPKPQYCGGMQEAMDNDSMLFRDGKLCVDVDANTSKYMYRIIKRCPFCPDGKNCLEDKK